MVSKLLLTGTFYQYFPCCVCFGDLLERRKSDGVKKGVYYSIDLRGKQVATCVQRQVNGYLFVYVW